MWLKFVDCIPFVACCAVFLLIQIMRIGCFTQSIISTVEIFQDRKSGLHSMGHVICAIVFVILTIFFILYGKALMGQFVDFIFSEV